MVTIAVPSKGKGGLNQDINLEFARCRNYTIVSVEKDEINEVRIIFNPASDSMGGLGVIAAKVISSNNVDAIIVWYIGPNAFKSLDSLGKKIYQASKEQISVKMCIESYIKGELKLISEANIKGHHGNHDNS